MLSLVLSACLNPVDFTRVMTQDGGGDRVLPAGADGKDAGGPAGIQDMFSFTVTIPVNPKPGPGRTAGLDGDAIQYGGARNTFLLAVLDRATGKIADSAGGNRLDDGEESRDASVTLSPGNYVFLLLMGHRERDYAQEAANDGGDYVYKAGPPTLLAAGLTEEVEIPASPTPVTITMTPVTVEAEFISSAPTDTTVSVDDTEGVTLEAGRKDLELAWTVSGLDDLKAAQTAAGANRGSLFRAVSGRAWETGDSYTTFSTSARFDGTDNTVTLDLGEPPAGVPCAAWFNLEYAPFSLNTGNGETWVIRNGINDLAQDSDTDFDLDADSEKVKWNGALCYTVPASGITDLDLTLKVPAPVRDAVPVLFFAAAGYTGTVAWEPAVAAGPKFAGGTEYTAAVTLDAKAGWTFTGIPEAPETGSFTHGSGTVSHGAGASKTLNVTLSFPATMKDVGFELTW